MVKSNNSFLNFRERDSLITKIKNFRSHNGDVLNIAICGQVAAGKSAFYNTIESTFEGEILQTANAGVSNGSVTTRLTRYPLPCKGVYLWDTMGFGPGVYDQVQVQVFFLLKSTRVNWQTS